MNTSFFTPVLLKSQKKTFTGNPNHLLIFRNLLKSKGVNGWNEWYINSNETKFDLSGINISGLDLSEINLTRAILTGANLSHCLLYNASMWDVILNDADLSYAKLDGAKLNYSQLSGSNLSNARIVSADLTLADARQAKFISTNISYSNLSGANLQGATLSSTYITGTNTWNIKTDSTTIQEKLIIEEWIDPLEEFVDSDNSGIDQIVIKTNNIETAHLLYLLTRRNKEDKSEKIKSVIDTMTQNTVLILGNFGLRRKAILKTIRSELAIKEYVPVIFDFTPPADRDLIESVAILAGLSRFIIADFTSPRSTPLEALLIISGFKVPFAPIIAEDKSMFGMFKALQAKYDWVLEPWKYSNKEQLRRNLKARVINPCEAMRDKIEKRRAQTI